MKIMNQFFHMVHQLMIIYYHTKFGKERLSGPGDTEQTQLYTLTELQTDRPGTMVMAATTSSRMGVQSPEQPGNGQPQLLATGPMP